MIPYAKWKFEGLDKAVEAAKVTHGIEGALYSDVSDRRGNQGVKNSPGIYKNIGATGSTGMDLWRHYQYTLDRDYLERYAYPVMLEIVRFYSNKLEKGDNGKYHIPEALPNESPMDLLSSNTTSDLAAIRNLFPAFIQASAELHQDKPLRRRAEEILLNLSAFVITNVPDDALPWGPLKPGDPLIAYGTRLESGLPGHPWSTRPNWAPNASMNRPASSHAINAQLTPVFPANLVSLEDTGTVFFKACRSAALSFDPVNLHGHATVPICFARLGLKEYLPDLLDRWIDNFQIFPQGLFCYFRRDYKEAYEMGAYGSPYSASEHKIHGLGSNVRVMFSDPVATVELLRQPFAHMALEAGSILEATINEMLLQSHKGKIRVFPAVPDDWASCFKLHAQGGFEVISERADREVRYIAIKSLSGQPCIVSNPWDAGESVRVRLADSDSSILDISNATELNFKTEAGKTYIIERFNNPLSTYGQITIGGTRNMEPKTKKRAQLGIPRRF